jgi:hypothetical protein
MRLFDNKRPGALGYRVVRSRFRLPTRAVNLVTVLADVRDRLSSPSLAHMAASTNPSMSRLPGTVPGTASLTVMPLKRFLVALCLITVPLPAGAQPSGDLGWSTLTNRRGASVDFPGGLFPNEVSNDDRLLAFTTADNQSRFELFSIPNSRGESPAQFVRRQGNRQRLDYKRVAANFIAAVISAEE